MSPVPSIVIECCCCIARTSWMSDVPDRTDNGPCQGERSAPLSPGNGWLRPHCNHLIALVLLPPVDRPSGWIVPPAVDISLARASRPRTMGEEEGVCCSLPADAASPVGRWPPCRSHCWSPPPSGRSRAARFAAGNAGVQLNGSSQFVIVRRGRGDGRAGRVRVHPRAVVQADRRGRRAEHRHRRARQRHPVDHEGSERGARRRPT